MKYILGIDCAPGGRRPDVFAERIKNTFKLEGLDVSKTDSKCFGAWTWIFEDKRTNLRDEIHTELNLFYENGLIRGAVISSKAEKNTGKEVTDKRVVDFVRGVNQLCKDTGIKLMSYDWSEAMIETPEGKLYILDKEVANASSAGNEDDVEEITLPEYTAREVEDPKN